MPPENKRRANGNRRRSWREGTGSESTSPTPRRPEVRSEIGSRWRERAGERPLHEDVGQALPDLEPTAARAAKPAGTWAIVLGAVLMVAVAGILIWSSNLFSGGEPDPTPTPEDTVERTNQVIQVPTSDVDIETAPTHEPAKTVDSNFLVCIDPGHGGWDFGYERTNPSEFGPPWYNEAEITLPLSLLLRDELESRGIAVVMTRESAGAVNWQNLDVDGDGRVFDGTPQGRVAALRDELQARINICNEAGADIMISIHLNGIDNVSVNGYEVYYNSQRPFADRNIDLATFIYREMSASFAEVGFETTGRGTKDDLDLSADTHEFGGEQFLVMIGPEVVKPEYTIQPTNMPGVIIETLFISNTNDATFILNPANQKVLVEGWATGIEKYFDRYGDD